MNTSIPERNYKAFVNGFNRDPFTLHYENGTEMRIYVMQINYSINSILEES